MWVWILLVYSPLCEAALGEPPRVSPTSSIYFPHAGAAFLSSRDWLLITTINLDPYDQLLHQMKTEIDNFAHAVDSLNDVYQETRNQDAGDSQPQIMRAWIKGINPAGILSGVRSDYVPKSSDYLNP